MVICKGTSPGTAANRVITEGIVESERAQIVAIPPEREGDFLPYEDKLLSQADIAKAFPKEPFVNTFVG